MDSFLAKFFNFMLRLCSPNQLWLVCSLLAGVESASPRAHELGLNATATLCVILIIFVALLLVLPLALVGVGTGDTPSPKKARKGQRFGSCGHTMWELDPHSCCPGCREKGRGPDACSKNEQCEICDSLTPVQRRKIANRRSYQQRKAKKDARSLEAGECSAYDTGPESVYDRSYDRLNKSADRSDELGLGSLAIESGMPMNEDTLLGVETDPVTGAVTGVTGVTPDVAGMSAILLGPCNPEDGSSYHRSSLLDAPIPSQRSDPLKPSAAPVTDIQPSASGHISHGPQFVVPQQGVRPPTVHRVPGIIPIPMTPRTSHLHRVTEELKAANMRELAVMGKKLASQVQEDIKPDLMKQIRDSIREAMVLQQQFPGPYPPPTATVSVPPKESIPEDARWVERPAGPDKMEVDAPLEETAPKREDKHEHRKREKSSHKSKKPRHRSDSSPDSSEERRRRRRDRGKAPKSKSKAEEIVQIQKSSLREEKDRYASQGARPKERPTGSDRSRPHRSPSPSSSIDSGRARSLAKAKQLAREFNARAAAEAAETEAREQVLREEKRQLEARQQSYCENLALIRSILKIDEASVKPANKAPDCMFQMPRVAASQSTPPMMMPPEPSLEARFSELNLMVDGTGVKPPGKALPKPKMVERRPGPDWYPLANPLGPHQL